jgi:TRAP-type C4-dicarboxylate transport system substrate-binding protein
MVATIRVAGYAPRDSVHSRTVAHFAERLHARVGDAAEVDVTWNVMDHGRPVSDLPDMVERGELTWCYLSTSYLAQRVPALDQLERPFQFATLDEAHAALDGDLGSALTHATEERTGLRVLGYWDNGFRHLTNRVRPVHRPADLAGMRVRIQPTQMHEAMIRAWGAEPVPVDLSEGIRLIMSGAVEAQENPLANSVAYGVDRVHRHVTMTAHLYGARGIYASPARLADLPDDVAGALVRSVTEAIEFQRQEAAVEETRLRGRLERAGLQFVDPTPDERDAFAGAVADLTAGGTP